MKNKTYRFAAALAVLLALLVFVAPVGATTGDTDITQSDFTNGYYNIRVSELTGDTTFTLTENVNGKIVIEQTADNAPIRHITITSSEGVTLNGGIVIRTVNYDIQPITVTVKDMNIYMNASMGVSEGDYAATDGSDVFAVHVTDEVGHGPNIKVNVIDNKITFDKDILTAEKRASILHVHNGGLVHGSQLTGNTATGVTGAAFCFAGASALNPAPSNSGDYAENPENIVISNNDVEITPIGSEWAIYGSESALVKIFHNGENVVPYKIKENTVAVDTTESWQIPVLLVKNVQSGKESTIFKSTEIKLEGNTITSGYPIYVLEPLSEGTSFTTEHFKSFVVSDAVAKIGNTNYYSLEEAIAAAEAGDTVTLIADITTDSKITVDKSITIDGNGKTLTRTGDVGAVIYLKNSTDDVTLDVTLQNFKEIHGIYAVYLGSKSDLTVKDSTLNAWGAIYFANHEPDNDDADGSTVTVSGSTLIGTNKQTTGNQNDFGTIVFESGNSTATITDSIVMAIAEGTKNQSIVRFSSWYGPNSYDVVTFTGGELVLEKGNSPASTFVWTAADAVDDIVTVGEGVTANFNPSAYIASGMEVVQPGDKYLVQKYVDRSSSSSSSSSTTEPEEPEQPEEPVVDPEVPTEEPVAGEVTVETEVTDGGEVELETPAAEGEGGSAAADEDEAKITGVVLPTGTDSEVTFVPVSEQPAPAGQEENTKKVFEINVPTYEKGKPAVIKFQMTVEELAADGKEAADVALWHFDEETGEWTKLVTSYTIVDGVVYFEAITEDFSPFAIIYEDEPADEPVEEPETPASPAPVLGLLAALGAAVVLRRK